jgi:hypothetical protein
MGRSPTIPPEPGPAIVLAVLAGEVSIAEAARHQEPRHFPNDDAVIKLPWPAICTIEDKRAQTPRQGSRPRPQRQTSSRRALVEGQTTTSWKVKCRRWWRACPAADKSPRLPLSRPLHPTT